MVARNSALNAVSLVVKAVFSQTGWRGRDKSPPDDFHFTFQRCKCSRSPPQPGLVHSGSVLVKEPGHVQMSMGSCPVHGSLGAAPAARSMEPLHHVKVAVDRLPPVMFMDTLNTLVWASSSLTFMLCTHPVVLHLGWLCVVAHIMGLVPSHPSSILVNSSRASACLPRS